MSNLAKSLESGAGRHAFAGTDYFVKFHKDVGRSSVMQLLFCRVFKIAISEATGERANGDKRGFWLLRLGKEPGYSKKRDLHNN
jgi:hypothetical protein